MGGEGRGRAILMDCIGRDGLFSYFSYFSYFGVMMLFWGDDIYGVMLWPAP